MNFKEIGISGRTICMSPDKFYDGISIGRSMLVLSKNYVFIAEYKGNH